MWPVDFASAGAFGSWLRLAGGGGGGRMVHTSTSCRGGLGVWTQLLVNSKGSQLEREAGQKDFLKNHHFYMCFTLRILTTSSQRKSIHGGGSLTSKPFYTSESVPNLISTHCPEAEEAPFCPGLILSCAPVILSSLQEPLHRALWALAFCWFQQINMLDLPLT